MSEPLTLQYRDQAIITKEPLTNLSITMIEITRLFVPSDPVSYQKWKSLMISLIVYKEIFLQEKKKVKFELVKVLDFVSRVHARENQVRWHHIEVDKARIWDILWGP